MIELVLIDFEHDAKTIVLRHDLDEESVRDILERKKTSVFKTLLNRPKREEVHVRSVNLFYESVLMVSATYTADFFRKAIHQIKVDHNVSEVVLGEGVFPVRSKSSVQRALTGSHGKNRIDLMLEEHVHMQSKDTMYFDHRGKESKFPFKLDSKNIENYPKRILRNSEPNVKRPEITVKEALTKLGQRLQRPIESDVRDLNDEFSVNAVSEIYVPVFEARLTGPKKKVGILRIDAVRKKIL